MGREAWGNPLGSSQEYAEKMKSIRPEITSRKTSPAATLLRKTEVTALLGVSTWTVEEWVRRGIIPTPIYMTDGSPGQWRVRDIEAVIDKARRRRRRRRTPTAGRRNLAQYRGDA